MMPPPKSAEPLLPILIVLHQEQSSPGRVGQMLQARGHALDIRRPRFDDPLPTTMAGHAGAVIFGGPMSANDSDPWIRREIDWIGVPLAEDKPFLGICLGAQMLVRQLGGTVFAHEREEVEVGWYPLLPTEAGRARIDWPDKVYQWHSEGFDLPTGATLLATGERFPNQAIAHGRAAWGVQFHPELTWAMMNRWTVRAAHRLGAPGAQSRRHHFEGRGLHDHQTLRWTERFLDLWLAP
ncbi:glutamine amidotransferase [Siculibacillus lacustris]|uniref:Glutamine amidotransferase n=1 Tax=Siculibacillus lacustris TaxID=1549641 RepID=A0A4Q9VLE1_9HYPH|nr:glutamine amidotransferase [Siculibacillus lacustris]TBW36277.1 glutamine amidotransferase [Siculibacillus lacustris]